MKRGRERYGIEITTEFLTDLRNLVATGRAQLQYRTSLRCSVYTATHNNITVRFVYDCHRKSIVTFLPLVDGKDYLEKTGSFGDIQ